MFSSNDLHSQESSHRENLVFPISLPSHRPQLISNNHEHYDTMGLIEKFNDLKLVNENENEIPVQSKSVSFNERCFSNFETMNNNVGVSDINKYRNQYPMNARNPTSVQRDHLEKSRMRESTSFKEIQGGNIVMYNDNKPRSTRIEQKTRQQSNYVAIPMNGAVPMNQV